MAEIVFVGADDWEQWRELRLRALREDPDAFGSTVERELAFTEQDWRDRLAAGRPVVLAVDEDRSVGMGAGWLDGERSMMVVAMWVEPAARGQGVGRQVLDALVGFALDEGWSVHLCVTDGNDSARALYEGYGFVATGRTEPLRPGSPLTISYLELG